VLHSVYDWFSGLTFVQKVLVGLFAALFLFSLSYILSTAFLYFVGAGEQPGSPTDEGAVPNTVRAPSSASARAETTTPDARLSITGARWEEEKVVVEGTWKGELSSVHCGLLQGGTSGKSTRWWDRSVAAKMDWSGRTFTQEFVPASGGEGGESPDAQARYGILCSGQFSGGWQMADTAFVEGRPPG